MGKMVPNLRVDDGAVHSKGSWGGGPGLGQREHSQFDSVEFEVSM